MDEPFAALDMRRKNEILPYLDKLHGELAIPVLYISHQPDEITRLADHLVLLDDGHAIASGPLHQMLARLDPPTAFADDAGVVIEAAVGEHNANYQLMRLEFPGGGILVSRRAINIGQRVCFQVHASDVSIAVCSSMSTAEPVVLVVPVPPRRPAALPCMPPAHGVDPE